MDANGQRFWLLADKNHWELKGNSSGLEYDLDRRSLRLASQRREENFNDREDLLEERLSKTPQTLDSYGNRAYWEEGENSRGIMATGAMDEEIMIYQPPPDFGTPTDLVMGHDGILYIAFKNRVVLHDRRERWEDTVINPDEFNPWRMAANPEGGVWVLDKKAGSVAKVQGQPLPKFLKSSPPDAFLPCEENPDPPRLKVLKKVAWPAGEEPIALASSPQGQLAFLSGMEGEFSKVRFLNKDESLSSPMELKGANHPYSLGWVSENRIAILLAGVSQEALAYRTDAAGSEATQQPPVGDLYPLKDDFNGEPFIHVLEFPLYYPTVNGSHPLHRLSFSIYSKKGFALNNPSFAPLDSQDRTMVWHRLFLEAVIPAGCGIKVWVSASQEPLASRENLNEDWYEHRFGGIYHKSSASRVPVGVWESMASELPHHPGLLPCGREKNESGLFSVLLQRSSRKVRSLTGRFLNIWVELEGTGHATPEIFAVRAYGSRFSYVDEYLPQLYKETVFLPEADNKVTEDNGTATGSDFLERFVGNVEGVLTSLEDRVANSHLLTHPQTVPEDSLEWLGSWVGFDFEPGLPRARRRNFLQAAPDLSRWHGTLRGLKLSLELATGGISGGEIVVLEDFKLRRTFATIIGADLDDENDPLTTGAAISGNSYVGDTLFLGEEHKKEFLALFSADLPIDDSEQAAIDTLFDKLAHRVTVLVHEEVVPQDLGLIRQMAAREVPAHVELRVLSATHPFIVGMASLVGVDTYLANRIPPQPARIGKSRMGLRDFVQGPMALDPRLEGIGSGIPQPPIQRPIARAQGATKNLGEDISLDASESQAFEGRKITKYDWKYIGRRNSL